ncbi:hypothetical protein PGB34_09815 [Xenophilus arseniciresistens]|uniref:Uncharacterized protein n=1 Tax=Xenophilus arseniciresistens TaxID=1283306 RepID=A0AAE3SZL8_9BURK|nr:ABC-three component system middle component 5 [Xenophilus arseniciresistens]MDA7416660.1 hypothetical protein [Xenophilus arseniciresistens]
MSNPYRTPIGLKKVFEDIQKIQDPALACLKTINVIRIDANNFLTLAAANIPSEINARCVQIREEEKFFFEQCLPSFLSIHLNGEDGLKDRSGLMEYRYDAA